MYIVRNSNTEIVAICTVKEDAEALKSAATIDNDSYIIEDTSEDTVINKYFLQLEDGYEEGQHA